MPQRVRVPLRIVVGYYSDAAVSVYTKVAALERRETGCEAGVAYLAGLLGISRSTVERSLTQLMRPDPVDDVAEVTSYRRTLPGGTGTTAVRRVRATSRAERGAWVPSRAAEALSPRQLRTYAALAYATATSHHLTLTDLGRVLRHRSGQKAGQPLDPRSVRRILRSLEDLGWITVDRRAGYRGRHVYTVHEEPTQAPLTADSDDGSGGDLDAGSLASKEHHQTDSPDDPPSAASVIRRRREHVVARGPMANPVLAPPHGRPYAAAGLTLAPRIWRVLEPIKPLLPGLSPYVVREAAREIGRQLDAGTDEHLLRARLEFRFASTETIRDPARWLLGAALRPPGPGSVGAWRPPGHWHECEACRAPSRTPLPDGVCRTCRPPDPLTLLRRWQR
ncbi:hypothetical protein [Streptomyces canus]|uniref:hypothetical protein n=1 Tax=Streptomyces canus TaxID=58343 RepID=UPI003CF3B3A3